MRGGIARAECLLATDQCIHRRHTRREWERTQQARMDIAASREILKRGARLLSNFCSATASDVRRILVVPATFKYSNPYPAKPAGARQANHQAFPQPEAG